VFRSNISPPSLGSKGKPSQKRGESGGKLRFLLGLFFEPEDGGGVKQKYTALQARKPYSS
jgi:hypothetical protein